MVIRIRIALTFYMLFASLLETTNKCFIANNNNFFFILDNYFTLFFHCKSAFKKYIRAVLRHNPHVIQLIPLNFIIE